MGLAPELGRRKGLLQACKVAAGSASDDHTGGVHALKSPAEPSMVRLIWVHQAGKPWLGVALVASNGRYRTRMSANPPKKRGAYSRLKRLTATATVSHTPQQPLPRTGRRFVLRASASSFAFSAGSIRAVTTMVSFAGTPVP